MATKEKEKIKELDPELYFKDIKERIKTNKDEDFKKLHDVLKVQMDKAFKLKQNKLLQKLLFTYDVLEKEKKAYDLGIRTFVYRTDVDYYIKEVEKNVVKIIDLKGYPREIPDEVAEIVAKLNKEKIFDEYYVVFTDYTGEVESQVKEERRRKDPILFGIFKTEAYGRQLHDRFYYIADWEDEFCDLTLVKMVDAMAAKGKQIERPVYLENVSEETVRDYVNSLIDRNNRLELQLKSKKKKSFFDKINIFKKGSK